MPTDWTCLISNMNTKLLLLLTIIFCSCKIEAQDYINYFHKINAAESLIGSSEYEKALVIYDELMKTYPNHFFKDLHNACLCALKLEKYKEALSFARDLVKHGYELKDFDSPAFDRFRNQKKYWNKFVSEYPQLRKQYEKNLNLPLREKYYTLYKIDQQGASLSDRRMLDNLLYELAGSLSGLIKESGFPHWFQNKDTIHHQFYIMLRHFCGLKNRIMDSEEMQQDSLYARMTNNDIPLLIEQALHKGLITPELYEMATTYWDYSNPYGRLAIMIDFNIEKVYPFLQADASKIPEINRRREQIGLPPVTGELSDSLLNTTWFRFYPFQEIQEAALSCDTCKSVRDYSSMINKGNFERQAMNKYLQEKQKTDFILKDWSEIRELHSVGLYKFVEQNK